MDLLSRIAGWLSENEATISAVVGIAVLGGLVLAGVRSLLLRRRAGSSEERAPVGADAPKAADSSVPGLDSFTVPEFEGRPAIAVLPFDNLSGDPEQQYFADGLAEDLITRLSRWHQLLVIARNSSFIYKAKPVDVKQVSRELGVRYVVEGSVRRAGNRVRISAQLIDATTGHHLWAEQYDRELRDVFTIQDEIAEAIAGSLWPEVARSEKERVASREPRNLGAWECLQKGWWHAQKLTKEDNAKARPLLERALEMDPSLAYALAGLSRTHYYDVLHQWTASPDRSTSEAVRAAERSVGIDDRDESAHLALGLAYSLTGQRGREIAAFTTAVQLNPSSSGAHFYLGIALAREGKPDEAIANLEKAIRLSPRDPYTWSYLFGIAMAHFAAERYEDAVVWARRSLEHKADWPMTFTVLAASCTYLDRLDEARAATEELLRLNPGFSIGGLRPLLAASDPSFAERALDALRKAGLPE